MILKYKINDQCHRETEFDVIIWETMNRVKVAGGEAMPQSHAKSSKILSKHKWHKLVNRAKGNWETKAP